MKRLDIWRVLKGEMPPEDFSVAYEEELRRHTEKLCKGGASAPVYLEGDEYIFVNDDGFRRILTYTREGRLETPLLVYLLDALSLDEKTRFANSTLRGALLDMADNGASNVDIDLFLGILPI